MGDEAATTTADSGMQSLLSLSAAAASAQPIPIAAGAPQDNGSFAPSSYTGSSGLAGGARSGSVGVGSAGKPHNALKHRRVSSSSQARRRLSDAREAATRPSPATIQTAAAALNSLAQLSLSGSPPPQGPAPSLASVSFTSASGVIQSASSASRPIPTASAHAAPKAEARDEELDLADTFSSAPAAGQQAKAEINGAGISVSSKNGNGKKRSTIFKCESCSKVYRHPSCLIKHRWEHSPHWREASKFLLSKHQQVQLLEAAAILSHLAPSATGGTSLPEDRSLWPSYLSGGLLPPPDTANRIGGNTGTPSFEAGLSSFSLDPPTPHPTSSSVPSSTTLAFKPALKSKPSTRSPSAGPRMHDYAVPGTGITHFRPGLLGVPTGPGASSAPVDVPAVPREAGYTFIGAASDAWSSPASAGGLAFAQSVRSASSFSAFSASASGQGQSYSEGAGGWSLPRSSLRSGSRSRSGSVSESDYVDVDGEDEYAARGVWQRGDALRAGGGVGKKIEEEWDGMEMEMEM
ncbi:hypothetical protein OBBRIDRAFT_795646 [Obba rivulosa]|uniref:C2H2-type domain-containing protein n=1 Tax=Obba rivulosa TaxID=1052685 RepID=A0A8E2ATE2_9APHY|nr:hypothetical protein OBBRIDRAFT_795646 [Obba rivulosa]